MAPEPSNAPRSFDVAILKVGAMKVTRLQRWVERGLLLALLILVMGPAVADSDTDQLMVSVNVTSGCALQGGEMTFGDYLSGQPNDLDAVGSINFIDCTGNLLVSLDGGGSGSVTDRRMRSGENDMTYQLYRNPSRTAIWGSGAEAREITLLDTHSGVIPVYGRVPGLQHVPDGLYTDIVNITLTF